MFPACSRALIPQLTKKLLLILAFVAAHVAGPKESMAASHAASAVVGTSHGGAGSVDVLATSHNATPVLVAWGRARTRDDRGLSLAENSESAPEWFASVFARRSSSGGSINPGRFMSLGLPDTRAP